MTRMTSKALALAAAVAVVLGLGGLAFAAADPVPSGDPAVTIFACVTSGGRLVNVNLSARQACPSGAVPVSWLAAGPAPTPTPTTPTPTPTPTPTTTSPPPGACVTSVLGGVCGPYAYPAIPMSNGYDTYVMDQSVNPASGTANTLTAADPGNWHVKATEADCGGCVQMFAAVQQLTNDWNGSGWGGSGMSDTPLASLSALAVHYSETTPSDPGTQAEFAPDVWDSAAANDVMFWADTTPFRCTGNGLNTSDILGQAALGGQAWTVYHYGTEVIFILDGTASTDPVTTGTCAQQAAGTIDILGGFRWLVANGVMPGLGNLTQLNTGWEITAADATTFTMNSYSVTAAVA